MPLKALSHSSYVLSLAACITQEVLAVSDDPLGKEGLRLGDSGRLDKSVGEVYVGPMSDGKFAVVMFNRGKRRFIVVC